MMFAGAVASQLEEEKEARSAFYDLYQFFFFPLWGLVSPGGLESTSGRKILRYYWIGFFFFFGIAGS